MGRAKLLATAAASLALMVPFGPTTASEQPSLNFAGVPGLIDMPGGLSAPDGQFSAVVSNFGPIGRITLGFQFSPRLFGSFRYSRSANLNYGGYVNYFDRSFDARFRLVDEGKYVPGVTIGLQDMLGTGLYSAEYIVATKTLTPSLRATLGLGWGRMASYGAIASPFGPRPPPSAVGQGGMLRTGDWFRGPMAPFGGLEYDLNDKLTLKLEYSSDIYAFEAGNRGTFARRSPLNVGAEYKLKNGFRLGAYYMYGSTFGLSAQFMLNPSRPLVKGQRIAAPLPVSARDLAAARTWGDLPAPTGAALAKIRTDASDTLAGDGLVLEGLRIDGSAATVYFRNLRLDAEPQALGRVARAMTHLLPPGVEQIRLVPMVNGVPMSSVTLQRRDLETFESAADGTEMMLSRAVIGPGPGRMPRQDRLGTVYPRFSWAISPDFSSSLFDPDAPFLGALELRGDVRYEIAPGFILSGSVSQQLVSTFNRSTRVSNSVLPHVRSDSLLYLQQGTTAVEELTAAYYFKPGPNLYGRVTAGYLERMFGGVSGELLWKPVNSRLALGAEVNWVKQRAYDGGFGFQPYSVATGNLSAYYEFNKGYEVAVHAGRYLAGDVGATFELNRRFANGWKVGAFATITNVSAKDFGEGSFDKGIRVEVPISWLTGRPSRSTRTTVIRPVQRDGGQRLNIEGRLYESVRDYHQESLTNEWGTFWK